MKKHHWHTYTGMHHFMALDFIKLWEFCVNLACSKFTGTVFSNSICLLHVSGPHFGSSGDMSDMFMFIVFVMVICDQSSLRTTLAALGLLDVYPQKTGNLN